MKIATADKNLNLEVFFIKTMPSYKILRKKEKSGELKKNPDETNEIQNTVNSLSCMGFFYFSRKKKSLLYQNFNIKI